MGRVYWNYHVRKVGTVMSEKIDVRKVESELVAALAADRKYERENDAKIRAVTQKVASYEEFQEMVKGCQLRALDGDNMKGGRYKQPWNPTTCGGGGGGGGKEGGEGRGIRIENDPPQNAQSFIRQWRKMKGCHNEQYRFLLTVGRDHILQLFRVEISMGLLGEILIVLNKEWQIQDRESVLGILDALSKSSRFNLSLDFLSKNEKQSCQELFARLSQADVSQAQSDITRLAALYTH